MQNYERKIGFLMLKLFISFFIFVFVFSYQQLQASPNMQEPIYYKYSDAIVNPYCTYLKKTYQLHCYGNGGGFLENINNIQLNFNGIRNLSIEEARILIIECTEELLKRINEDTQVRPYLSHYPFTEKGLTLLINFDKKNGETVDANFIADVFTCNEMIYYDIYDPQKNLLKKIYQEPYQNALQIATQSKILKKPSVITQKENPPSKINTICQHIKEKFSKP